MLCDVKSEFCYIGLEAVQALALTKRYLLKSIFPVFPRTIFKDYQTRSKVRYTYFKESILKHREIRLSHLNKKNEYFKIQMNELQPVEMKSTQIMPSTEMTKIQEVANDMNGDLNDVVVAFGKFCKSLDTEY